MTELYVRAVKDDELELAAAVYADGRRAIASLGIDQWQEGYPPRELTAEDIANGLLYAAFDEENDRIAAVAAMVPPPDYDYDAIDGEWIGGGNYTAVHRVAASDAYRGSGASSFLLAEIECMARRRGYTSIRIDTHRGNVVMQKFLRRRGFCLCGKITLSHGGGDRIRLAYEKLI